MATQVVELTGDEKKLFQAIDRLIQKEVQHERQLDAMGSSGASAGTQIEASLGRVARANERDIGRFIKDLGRIGPAGRTAADALKASFAEQDKYGFRNVDTLIEGIRRIDPEGAAAAAAVLTEMQEADRESEFRDTLRSLERLGDEGRQAAAVIEAELKDAERNAAAGMEGILAKLQELRPEADLSAEAIEAKLKAASEASQREFESTIETLRKLGPTGQQVADRLQNEMKAAGDSSEHSIDGVIAKLREINPQAATAAKSIYREIDKNNDKAKGSFKDLATSAGSELKSIVGSYIGIQAAIQTIIELNQKVIETNREAFSNLRRTESGDSRLLQVSTSQEEFQLLRSNADRLASDYGIDREVTRDLVFRGKSENFADTLDFIGKNSQVIDVQAQAQVAGQIPGLFAATGEKLTGAQAINQTLAGAAESRLSFEEIARALPSAAEGGSLAGASSDETIATLSVLASRFKSADTAADRIKALATKIGLDKGDDTRGSFAGSGLLGAVDKIAALNEDERTAFLGNSQEVNAAYEFIQQEYNKIRERQNVVRKAREDTGTRQSPTALRVEAANNDVKLRVELESRRAEIQKEIAQENRRAVVEGNRQKRRDEALRDADNQLVHDFAIAASEFYSSGLEKVAGVPDDGTLLRAVASEDIDNLFRDVSFASQRGDEKATPASLAISKLRNARRKDPEAVLGRDAVAEFIRGTTGEFVSPADVTDEQRQNLTQSILEQAKEAKGFERTASLSIVNLADAVTGGNAENVPFVGLAGRFAASAGSQSAADIQTRFLSAMKDSLDRNNRLIERQLEESRLSREANQAAAAAAEVTAAAVSAPPAPPTVAPNYGDAQRGRL